MDINYHNDRYYCYWEHHLNHFGSLGEHLDHYGIPDSSFKSESRSPVNIYDCEWCWCWCWCRLMISMMSSGKQYGQDSSTNAFPHSRILDRTMTSQIMSLMAITRRTIGISSIICRFRWTIDGIDIIDIITDIIDIRSVAHPPPTYSKPTPSLDPWPILLTFVVQDPCSVCASWLHQWLNDYLNEEMYKWMNDFDWMNEWLNELIARGTLNLICKSPPLPRVLD